MKIFLRIVLVVFLLGAVALGYGAWILLGSKTSNPRNYRTIGDIPTPWGYERVQGDDPAYSNYLRSLPLKARGSEVMLYTGGPSRLQSLNYAVVDLPLLSNDEQCADVCMRLRAEYLYHTGQYGRIHFRNVNGKVMMKRQYQRPLAHVRTVEFKGLLMQASLTRVSTNLSDDDAIHYGGGSNTDARVKAESWGLTDHPISTMVKKLW